MIRKSLASLALTASLVTSVNTVFASTAHAQSNNYPYSFCTKDTDTPTQELTDSIAYVVDYNYQGGVKQVAPVCYGLNRRAENRPIWVYKVEFNDGSFLDVAIMTNANGNRLISIQDDRTASGIADGSGWTKWIPLKTPPTR